MVRNKNFQKFASAFLLVAFTSSLFVGLFDFAQQADAFAQGIGISLPTQSSGGSTFGQAESGNLTSLEIDETSKWSEIAKAATVAAMNTALRAMSKKLNATLNARLGVKNYLYYQDALVESKYLVDQFKKEIGQGNVPSSGGSSGDPELIGGILDVARTFETGLGVNAATVGATDAARMATAISQSQTLTKAQKNKLYTQLIVGAVSLYVPAVACGGVNNRAIQNTSTFLATTNAGKRAIDINPSSPNFYQDMLKQGEPYSNPNFWTLNFQASAAEHESKARDAAALELLSPGLKATQKTEGKEIASIGKNMSLVAVTQAGSQNAIFQIAYKGADGATYSGASFQAFIAKILVSKGIDVLWDRISRWIGTAAPAIVKTAAKLEAFKLFAEAAGKAVVKGVVAYYATKMYDTVAGMVFDGKFLTETSACRQQPRARDFTDDDKTFKQVEPQSFDIPNYEGGTGGGNGNSQLVFLVDPQNIAAGDKVTLSWDATLLDTNQNGSVVVTLNGGKFSNQIVDIAGGDIDTPQVTTTYTLTAGTVGAANGQVVSRTVTVGAAGGNTLTVNKTGAGTVASADGKITCGATCSASFPVGTAVTLTATPDAGASFTGWSGGVCSGTGLTCSLTMNAAAQVTAAFTGGGGGNVTVTTNAATGIAASAATLNGTITTPGSGGTVWFEWADNPGGNNPQNTAFQSVSTTAGVPANFSTTLSGLQANHTYSFRARGRNADGSGTNGGAVLSFTTPAVAGAFTQAFNVRE